MTCMINHSPVDLPPFGVSAARTDPLRRTEPLQARSRQGHGKGGGRAGQEGYSQASAQDVPSDRELIRVIARGDRNALGKLYTRHKRGMMALGMSILNDRQEAEDTFHDVFVEVWHRAGEYDPRRGKVKSWLLMRMRCRSIDRYRSPRMSRRACLDDALERNHPALRTHRSLRGDRPKLAGALAELATKRSDVLRLVYGQGLTSREAGVALDIPAGTVKSRTAAAISQLRMILRTERSAA